MSVLSSVAPSFPEREAAAQLLHDVGRDRKIDPLTLIAVVENESRWQPSAKSADGSFGLAQIRATNFGECQTATFDEAKCETRKVRLLDWRDNLRIAAQNMAAARGYCKRRVGSDLAIHWLQAFQGYDSTRGTVCGHRRVGKRWVAGKVPLLTRKVLARRKELAAR